MTITHGQSFINYTT